MNLKSRAPELCFDCHDDIEELLSDATARHDPLTTGDSCVNCHNPHASSVEQLLLKEPMDLCLSCHDEALESDNGKLANIGQLLADNPSHHGPITQKDCSSCHQVHGGENFRMLAEAYPARFYAPFDEDSYALCFSCHESDMVLDEHTDDLTNFRNGELNLHFLHVNRKVKGGTCRACHNTHASKKPKHITETVPFGEWDIPLNFQQTATGGSCRPGCHKLYRYDRSEPVVNLPQP
jgi:predicted CXXCH cytochrome family protein